MKLKRQYLPLYVGTIIMAALLLSGFACRNGTQKLATASDAVAHSLANAQTAVAQGVADGVITQNDATSFNLQLSRVATAGLALDNAIRANEAAASVSAKVNAFLDAFNALQQQGVLGIKNPALKLTLSTIITGAESSIAIIAATVGK